MLWHSCLLPSVTKLNIGAASLMCLLIYDSGQCIHRCWSFHIMGVILLGFESKLQRLFCKITGKHIFWLNLKKAKEMYFNFYVNKLLLKFKTLVWSFSRLADRKYEHKATAEKFSMYLSMWINVLIITHIYHLDDMLCIVWTWTTVSPLKLLSIFLTWSRKVQASAR